MDLNGDDDEDGEWDDEDGEGMVKGAGPRCNLAHQINLRSKVQVADP